MKKFYTLFLSFFAVFALSAQNDTLVHMTFDDDDTLDIQVGAPSGNDDPFWINLDQDGIADGNGRPQEWFLSLGYADADSTNIVLASSSWLAGFAPGNRNYFISPQLHLGAGSAELSWASAPRQTPLYVDGYAVVVSTTDNLESSFTDTIFRAAQFLGAGTGQSTPSPVASFNTYGYSNGWVHGYDGSNIQLDAASDSTRFIGVLQNHQVDLSAYSNQSIHIAFIHNSDDDNLISIDNILVTGTNAASVEEDALKGSIQMFPNPTSEVLNVSYELPVSSEVSVVITDVTGRTMYTYSYGDMTPGDHNFSQDVSNYAAGSYFFTIEALGTTFTNSFVVQ